MRVSRAAFLKASGLALLGARVDTRALDTAVVHPVEVEGRTHGGRLRMQNVTAGLFLPHVNTPFAVPTANGTRLQLVLAEVIERPITKNVEQFSLIFHAPAGTAVHDGTYAFEHQVLGDFDLFIVSVGRSSSRRAVYQACFSRHLNAARGARARSSDAVPAMRT